MGASTLLFPLGNRGDSRRSKRGPETANPPRWSATGRLRHRRSDLPCPSATLRVATSAAPERSSVGQPIVAGQVAVRAAVTDATNRGDL
jgi:hypothetical protein